MLTQLFFHTLWLWEVTSDFTSEIFFSFLIHRMFLFQGTALGLQVQHCGRKVTPLDKALK